MNGITTELAGARAWYEAERSRLDRMALRQTAALLVAIACVCIYLTFRG